MVLQVSRSWSRSAASMLDASVRARTDVAVSTNYWTQKCIILHGHKPELPRRSFRRQKVCTAGFSLAQSIRKVLAQSRRTSRPKSAVPGISRLCCVSEQLHQAYNASYKAPPKSLPRQHCNVAKRFETGLEFAIDHARSAVDILDPYNQGMTYGF